MTTNGEKLVMFDGILYAKTNTNGWCALDISKLKSDYLTVYGRQPQITAPKHESDEKTETPSKGATSSGGGTGGGRGGLAHLGGEIHTKT
jgi:hypothetical protein